MVTLGWNSRLMSSAWSRHSHSAGGVGYKLIDLFIFLYAWCRADGPTLAGYYIDYIGVLLDSITDGLAECEGQATALFGEPLGDVGLEVLQELGQTLGKSIGGRPMVKVDVLVQTSTDVQEYQVWATIQGKTHMG